MAKIQLDLAGPADDEELRALLRRNPMPGAISLSFEREPSFFLGASIEGDSHQTVIGRMEGRIVGMASRSVHTAYLDGRPTRLGYLSQVRFDPTIRGREALAMGWARMKELHDEDPVDLYVTTIIADNLHARRTLERDRPTKPSYRPKGELHTLALTPRRGRPRSPREGEVRRGSAEMLADIAACIDRSYARYQFAPRWTAETLADPDRCRGLSPDDFLVALRGSRVVGCMAIWDQQGFKQNVVRGYSRTLGLSRPAVNLLSGLISLPRLPAVGEPVPHAFLSHVAADEDDQEVFISLLEHALSQVRDRDLSYLALGLMDDHPFLNAARRYRQIDYRAILYAVFWPDGEARARELGSLVPHVELATL